MNQPDRTLRRSSTARRGSELVTPALTLFGSPANLLLTLQVGFPSNLVAIALPPPTY